MPYTIDWLIPDEVIYVRYIGVTTADELRESLLKTRDYMEASPRFLVHGIIDVGEVTHPVSLKESMQVVREVGVHPRTGWSISIREKSPLIKMGAAIGSSIFQMRYRAFDTLEQAVKHLKLVDEMLSWDRINPAILDLHAV